MKNLKSVSAGWVIVSVLLLAWPGDVLAYIDPGTGSYVLQLIIAGLVGSAFSLKLFGRRIKGFFQRLTSGNKDASNVPPDEDD
jgi:hypothetical protein